jgi:transposase
MGPWRRSGRWWWPGGRRARPRSRLSNQIRHLSFTAPEQLRQRLAGVSRHHLAARAAGLRPATGEGAHPVIAATKTALRILGRRVLALDAEKARIDALLSGLVTQTAPQLLALFGVGIDTAAALLVTAGDNPGPAAVGGRVGAPVRHRAHPGLPGEGDPLPAGPRRRPAGQLRPVGDRDHPAAQRPAHEGLHGPPLAEGRCKPEVIRVLKRYVAREACHRLPRT